MDTTQLLKGVLELAVLAILDERDSYGYAIVVALREAGHETVGEASVYGTLRRLAADGAVSTYQVQSAHGPNRKYHTLTEDGIERLRAGTKTWTSFSQTMSYLLREDTP